MSKASGRTKVEPGIWKRLDAQGHDVFEITWRDAEGKQRRRRVQGTITAARRALTDEKAKKGRGERITADPRLKLNAAADAWWNTRVIRLRATTQDAYKWNLLHLRKALGNRRLQDITAPDVARYVTDRQSAGAKGWTIKGEMTSLSGIYKFAARYLGYAGTNPVQALDQVERPSTSDEKPKRILTNVELSRLLGAITSHRLLYEVAADTGGRLGEVLGLTWGNVDLETEAITFTHQLDRGGKRVALKTKRARRTLEVAPDCTAALRAHKMASPASGTHDLVFLSRDGQPHDHRNVARILERAVGKVGLGAVERDGQVVEAAPSFHSLRHTHASALIAQGWDLEEVSARLGHSDIGTTQRAYVHAYDAAKRSPLRRDRLASLRAGRGSSVAAQDGSGGQQDGSQTSGDGAKVLDLRAAAAKAQ